MAVELLGPAYTDANLTALYTQYLSESGDSNSARNIVMAPLADKSILLLHILNKTDRHFMGTWMPNEDGTFTPLAMGDHSYAATTKGVSHGATVNTVAYNRFAIPFKVTEATTVSAIRGPATKGFMFGGTSYIGIATALGFTPTYISNGRATISAGTAVDGVRDTYVLPNPVTLAAGTQYYLVCDGARWGQTYTSNAWTQSGVTTSDMKADSSFTTTIVGWRVQFDLESRVYPSSRGDYLYSLVPMPTNGFALLTEKNNAMNLVRYTGLCVENGYIQLAANKNTAFNFTDKDGVVQSVQRNGTAIIHPLDDNRVLIIDGVRFGTPSTEPRIYALIACVADFSAGTVTPYVELDRRSSSLDGAFYRNGSYTPMNPVVAMDANTFAVVSWNSGSNNVESMYGRIVEVKMSGGVPTTGGRAFTIPRRIALDPFNLVRTTTGVTFGYYAADSPTGFRIDKLDWSAAGGWSGYATTAPSLLAPMVYSSFMDNLSTIKHPGQKIVQMDTADFSSTVTLGEYDSAGVLTTLLSWTHPAGIVATGREYESRWEALDAYRGVAWLPGAATGYLQQVRLALPVVTAGSAGTGPTRVRWWRGR